MSFIIMLSMAARQSNFSHTSELIIASLKYIPKGIVVSYDVCPSVHRSIRSESATILTDHFIFTHLINQLQYVCHMSSCWKKYKIWIFADCYASAFRRRRHYVFGLSVRPSARPSVRPKPEIPSFDLYIGPLVHPTNRYRFTACPSVRPSVRLSVRPDRFPGICRRLHGGISLKFYMLMYLDHLQNWLVYGHGLVIFLILALFGLSETGQIWGFRVFPGECMEEMTWNFARWCILTTFRTD